MKPQETPQLTPLQKAATARKLLEAEIVSRAWADDAFRAKLEADPASALAEAGIPLPEGRAIRVTSEAPDTLTLVIPPAPAQGEETSDTELEAVAGGGIMDTGRCQFYNDLWVVRDRGDKTQTALGSILAAVTGVVGFSWGWGDNLPQI